MTMRFWSRPWSLLPEADGAPDHASMNAQPAVTARDRLIDAAILGTVATGIVLAFAPICDSLNSLTMGRDMTGLTLQMSHRECESAETWPAKAAFCTVAQLSRPASLLFDANPRALQDFTVLSKSAGRKNLVAAAP